jgi:hypothetical protein
MARQKAGQNQPGKIALQCMINGDHLNMAT